MNYQVTRVEFAGQPNRRVWVHSDLDDSIERRIKDLKPTRDARARALKCWPPPEPHRTLFIYRFFKQSPMGTSLADGSLMYVRGNQVQFDDAVREDGSGDLEKWASEAMESGEAVRAAPCRLCDGSEPSGNPHPCPCDNPIDLSPWNVDTVIHHNNCYSFARNARWCVGGQGSQPGNRLSHNEHDIRKGLESDGLRPVTETQVLGDEPGDFVALFLEGEINYHFLRLDDDHWTHMHQGYAAIACDAAGRRIPKDGARRVNMQDFRFRDYYHIPPGTPALSFCG